MCVRVLGIVLELHFCKRSLFLEKYMMLLLNAVAIVSNQDRA